MTSTAFGRWLRAANPLGYPRGMAEAQRAAKMGAVALVLDAIVSAITAVWQAQNPGVFQQYMRAEMERQNPPAEQLALQEAFLGYLMPSILVMSALVIAVSLVLAWVQWRRMTRAIPIISLVFIAYSVTTSAVVLAMRGEAAPDIWPWSLLALGWGKTLLTTALWVAALKGSVALHRLNQQR